MAKRPAHQFDGKDHRKNKYYTASHPVNNIIHPRRLAAKEKSEKAWRMRLQKYSYKEIAQVCGYASHNIVANVMRQKIKEMEEETLEETRRLIDIQNDEVAKVLKEKALAGDIKACEAFLKYQDQKAKLFGCYAPQRVEKETKNYEIRVNNININKMLEGEVKEVKKIIEIENDDEEDDD